MRKLIITVVLAASAFAAAPAVSDASTGVTSTSTYTATYNSNTYDALECKRVVYNDYNTGYPGPTNHGQMAFFAYAYGIPPGVSVNVNWSMTPIGWFNGAWQGYCVSVYTIPSYGGHSYKFTIYEQLRYWTDGTHRDNLTYYRRVQRDGVTQTAWNIG